VWGFVGIPHRTRAHSIYREASYLPDAFVFLQDAAFTRSLKPKAGLVRPRAALFRPFPPFHEPKETGRASFHRVTVHAVREYSDVLCKADFSPPFQVGQPLWLLRPLWSFCRWTEHPFDDRRFRRGHHSSECLQSRLPMQKVEILRKFLFCAASSSSLMDCGQACGQNPQQLPECYCTQSGLCGICALVNFGRLFKALSRDRSWTMKGVSTSLGKISQQILPRCRVAI
jgi:hypothetical protein